MKGMFIVIEGPDGAGTTLHARLLSEKIRSTGRDVLVTAEPTNSMIGTLIRACLKGKEPIPSSALQLLFSADRAWHVEQVILPALSSGTVVISDRYIASTIAYGVSLGLDEQWLKDLNKTFLQPDLELFTLPPIAICMERILRRDKTDILEERSLQEKIHATYHRLAKDHPSIVVIDTSGEKKDSAEKIWSSVSQKF